MKHSSLDRMLDSMIGTIMMIALVNYITRQPDTAKRIAEAGQAFSSSIRAAQGLPLTPTAEEQLRLFRDSYLSSEDADLEEMEHNLDIKLGLAREFSNETFWHKGILGGMHGRKRGIHRGGPNHDPIWGETE